MSNRTQENTPQSNSTVSKGRMVEAIVASMHQEPGVSVQRNVRLPPARVKGAKREIDVLLTRDMSGYPVRIAIECKNELKPIGAKEIEAYCGKLDYLGIPVQHGIFVSASGYTTQALEVAEHAGLRLLRLNEITQALPEAIAQATQSILVLMLIAHDVAFSNFAYRPMSETEAFSLFGDDGQPRGTVLDLVWQRWFRGEVPAVIGEHQLSLEVPKGWHQMVDGQPVFIIEMNVKVQVVGLLVAIHGKVIGHALVNAANRTTERTQFSTVFDDQSTSYPVTRITTEAELDEVLAKLHSEGFSIQIGRIMAPRIQFWNLLWPPSERAKAIVEERMQAFEAGEGPDPRPFNLAETEGTDLSVLFEQTWE